MTDALFLFDPAAEGVPVNADELHTGWTIQLPVAVRRHALQSMRIGVGETLQLSDGHGLRIRAVVDDVEQGVVHVQAVGREPRPVTRLALIQALAKQGRDEEAIDAATQIGVDEVIPWQADRSIVKWKDGKTNRKWGAVLDAATEQSRRAWRPELADHVSSKGVLAICRRACVHGGLVVVLHQDADNDWNGVEQAVCELADASLTDGRSRTVYVVVGPEGGISDNEAAAFKSAGAHVCVLGRNILRAATAGPVALSLLSRVLGRF